MNTICLISNLPYYLIFSFSLLLQSNIVLSQQNIVDSLINLPAREKLVSTFDFNFALGQAYYDVNSDTSEYYYQEAIRKTNSDSLLAKTYLALGKIYFYKEPRSFIRANKQNELAVTYARKLQNKELLIYCLLQLSTSQNRIGKSSLALSNLIEAKQLAKAKTNPEIEYTISNKLGIAYFQAQVYDKAIENFRIAASYAKDDNQIGMIHINIASSYNKLNRPDSSILNYKKSLLHFTKINRNIDAALTGLSQAYLNKNEIDSAVYYCQKWYSFLEQSKSKRNFFSVYFQFGKIYQKSGNLEKAESYYLKTIEEYEDERKYDSKIRDAFYYLADINASKGNYQQAFKYLKEYQTQYDSILARINTTKLNELLELHEFEKTESDLLLTTKENERIKWQNRALIWMILAGITFVALAFFVIVQNIKRIRLLEEKKHLQLLKDKNLMQQDFHNLSKEFNQKKQDLVSYSLQLIHKKELLMTIGQELRKYKNLTEEERERSITNLVSAIRASLGNDKDWDNFRNYFESIHQDFFTRLNKQYPKLTTTDNRIAALIILGLDNKQAASILDVEPDSIKIAKNRLKKKLELNAEEDLRTKLSEFVNEPN